MIFPLQGSFLKKLGEEKPVFFCFLFFGGGGVVFEEKVEDQRLAG